MAILKNLIVQAFAWMFGWIFWTHIYKLITYHVVWLMIEMLLDWIKSLPMKLGMYLLNSLNFTVSGNFSNIGNYPEAGYEANGVDKSACDGKLLYIAIYSICLNVILIGAFAVTVLGGGQANPLRALWRGITHSIALFNDWGRVRCGHCKHSVNTDREGSGCNECARSQPEPQEQGFAPPPAVPHLTPDAPANAVSLAPVTTRRKRSQKSSPSTDGEEGTSAGPSTSQNPAVDEYESDQEITVTSLPRKELRQTRLDYARREGEPILSWALRCWDEGVDTVDLDKREAKLLGSLTRDAGLDKELAKLDGIHTLWARILNAIKSRYCSRDDLPWAPVRWTTMEQGIRYLRQMAVLEIIYGDGQLPSDPDEVPMRRPFVKKLTQGAPQKYAHTLGGILLTGQDGSPKTVCEFVNDLREYEDSVNQKPLISAIETMAKDIVKEIKTSMSELKKGSDASFSPSPSEWVQVSAVRNRPFSPRRSPQANRGMSRGSLWRFLCDHGEDMDTWHGQPTSALWNRVRELQGGHHGDNSSRRRAAPVSRSGPSRSRDPSPSNTGPCDKCGHRRQH